MKPITNIIIVLIVFIGIIYIYRKRKDGYDNTPASVASPAAPTDSTPAPAPAPAPAPPAPAASTPAPAPSDSTPAPAPSVRLDTRFMSKEQKALYIIKFFEDLKAADEKPLPKYVDYIELINQLNLSEKLKLKTVYYEFVDLFSHQPESKLSIGIILDRAQTQRAPALAPESSS